MSSDGLQVYRRLLKFVRPYRGRIALSMVASLGVALSDVATAKLVQPFIDRLVVAKEFELVKIVPFLVIGLAVFKGGSRYLQEYFIRTSGQLVMQDIRNRFQSHTIGLSMRFFSRNSTGTLMSRALNDVGVMQSSVSEVVVTLFREGMTLIGLVAMAFWSDWKLAGMAFVVLPLAAYPAALIGKRIKGYSRQGQGAMGELTAALEQGYSGIKVIKSFGTEAQEVARFRAENDRFYKFIRKVIKYDAASSPLMEIMASLGVATVFWYGLQRVLAGTMTQGELFSIIAAILLMYGPAKRLARVNNVIQMALGAAERVFEVLSETSEIQEQPGAKNLGRARGEVQFDRVSFAYDEETVLSEVSIDASPGEVIALVGPSGAGKTTLAGLLTRFYDPTAGVIRIDGIDIRELTLESLKRNIASVDQETFLFNDSLINNIRYGCEQASEAEVAEAARQAFADGFIAQLPDGYQSQIGDRGFKLSGGQRQRICIARAILRQAPILVLDEATSALDTESEAMVQQALSNLMRDRTTFVIAHRLSTIMNAHKIVVLEQGRVVEVGTHNELLQRGGLYQKLYEMQFKESA